MMRRRILLLLGCLALLSLAQAQEPTGAAKNEEGIRGRLVLQPDIIAFKDSTKKMVCIDSVVIETIAPDLILPLVYTNAGIFTCDTPIALGRTWPDTVLLYRNGGNDGPAIRLNSFLTYLKDNIRDWPLKAELYTLHPDKKTVQLKATKTEK